MTMDAPTTDEHNNNNDAEEEDDDDDDDDDNHNHNNNMMMMDEEGEDEEEDAQQEEEDEQQRQRSNVPLTTVRALIAAQHPGMRVTRGALRQLQHGTEAYARDLFLTAAALRDLQGLRTLHHNTFRVAARLSLLSVVGGSS